MPLTEQPGLFIGGRWNSKAWYVVDPGAEDPAASQRAWEARFARTNRPKVARVPVMLLAWAVFLAVAAAVSFGASLIPTSVPGSVLLSTLVVLVGFAVGAGLAAGLYSLVLPRREPSGDRVDNVVAVRPAVSTWAGAGDLAISDLWQLSTSIDRVSSVWELINEWGENFDYETHTERPTWALEKLLQPTVFAELAAQQKQLAKVAAHLSFPVPEHLMQEPKPFREYGES